MVAEGKFAYLGDEDTIKELVGNSSGSLARSPEKIELGVSFAPYAVKKGKQSSPAE